MFNSGAALVMVAVSCGYFARASSDTPLAWRLLSASHGLIGAALYLCAILVWVSGAARPAHGVPYAVSFVFPALLVVFSFFFFFFRGPRNTHWLQLLNVSAMFWAFFIGSMAVTGEWL